MKYKAIIFDLFGTLVDNFSINKYKNMNTAMATILEIEPLKFIDEWWGTFELRALGKIKGPEENIEYICEKIGKKVSGDKIKKAAKVRFDFGKVSLKPRQNYIQTLKKLIRLDYKLGLVSDCSYETVRAWENSQLRKIFKNPVFSAEVGIKKPDIRIYQIACKKLNVEPCHCIYVGDGSSNELTGAANAGMKPIRIQVPYEISEDNYMIDKDKLDCHIIKNIDELLDLDFKLCQFF